ncbi:MAG TPA: alpha/beta fold hydrolase [Drouetiella sp.]|jgi:regulator of replication initiation timing
MPLVFVHGVNVRLGPKYEKELQQRNQYFVNIFYKLLGRQFTADRVISPYWGDLATSTTSGNPFLPGQKSTSGQKHESSGVNPNSVGMDPEFTGDQLHDHDFDGGSLIDLARTDSISKVVDIVIATASEQASDSSLEHAEELSELAFSALELGRRFKSLDEQLQWLEGVVDDAQLLLKLQDELKKYTSVDIKRRALTLEHLKQAGNWLQTRYEQASTMTKDRLQLRKEQVRTKINELRDNAANTRLQLSEEQLKSRLDELRNKTTNSVKQASEARRRAATHIAAATLTSPVRKLFHDRLFLFLGDSFLYFGQRGTPEAPGPIVKTISDALDQAWALRTAEDPDLIVVAHSMGGNIICDIASYFRPDQRIDMLITVATQFPLFADLHMFPGLDTRHRPIAKPTNVERWINVYDMNDIFGFTAQPMFSDIEDLEFASGRLGMTTHADCFKFVSLYEQLARAVKS